MKEISSSRSFAPDGWPTVTPRIVAANAERLVQFVKNVFAATGGYRPDQPAVVRINGCILEKACRAIGAPSTAVSWRSAEEP